MMDGQQDWVCLGPPVLLRSPRASKNRHSGGPDGTVNLTHFLALAGL
jgi:hypothetical protein